MALWVLTVCIWLGSKGKTVLLSNIPVFRGVVVSRCQCHANELGVIALITDHMFIAERERPAFTR